MTMLTPDDEERDDLVSLATELRDEMVLPAGFNAVLVVTGPSGAWVGVSSTADSDYTTRMLQAALHGRDYRRHRTH